MKVEAITLREMHIPLIHFFETSFGRTYNRRVLLVTLHSNGLEGWASVSPEKLPTTPRNTSTEPGVSSWATLGRHYWARRCKPEGRCPHFLPGCASIAWPRPHWRTRRGMPKHRRKVSHCGSC